MYTSTHYTMQAFKRKRVRHLFPNVSLLKRAKLASVPETKTPQPNLRGKSDTVSVTSESDFIMPRISPRLDLFRALRHSDFVTQSAMERRNLNQVLEVMLACKATRRLSNPLDSNLLNGPSLKSRPRHHNILFVSSLLQYIHETRGYNSRITFILSMLSERYIAKRLPLPRSTSWLTRVLPSSPDHIFEHHTRMTRSSFGKLLHTLETKAPQFFVKSSRGRRQLEVCTQLHLALFPLGFYGNGASFENARAKFGYGVGTIQNCRRRVVDALVSLTSEYITWPTVFERRQLCMEAKERYGFHSCFFSVDGTTHNFASKPSYQTSTWFDRKSRYSMQALVTNDHNLRVRHLVVGWPGSTHDARVLGSADYMLSANEDFYFSGEERGLGDAAFGLHRRVVPNYKEPLSSYPENQEYNRIHSSLRVRSEHTIGHVKSRFQGTREIRMRLASKNDVQEIVKFITAAYVLHNILLDLNDEWTSSRLGMDTAGNTVAPEQNVDQGMEPINHSPRASDFREKVKEQVLRFANYL